MRKQYKRKKRSCAMCKPHKMGWEKRWHISDKRKLETARHEQNEAELSQT
jgi:hypothetical protein